MRYEDILSIQSDQTLPLHRNIATNDEHLAQLLLAVMSQYGIPCPVSREAMTNLRSVRANLSEFCVLELGEKHWKLYIKQMSWPANKDPWRPSSDPGIDILATDEDVNCLLVIEVKSSSGDGSGLVTSESDGLKGDFQQLFARDDRTRLGSRILDVAHDLRFQQNRPDLAEKAKSLVGNTPASSRGVKLVGVLMCSRGDQQAEGRRKRAFGRLHQWLLEDDGDEAQKWLASQCQYYVVELNSLPDWFDHLLP